MESGYNPSKCIKFVMLPHLYNLCILKIIFLFIDHLLIMPEDFCTKSMQLFQINVLSTLFEEGF